MSLKNLFNSPIMSLVLPLLFATFVGLALLAFPGSKLSSFSNRLRRRHEIERLNSQLKHGNWPAKKS